MHLLTRVTLPCAVCVFIVHLHLLSNRDQWSFLILIYTTIVPARKRRYELVWKTDRKDLRVFTIIVDLSVWCFVWKPHGKETVSRGPLTFLCTGSVHLDVHLLIYRCRSTACCTFSMLYKTSPRSNHHPEREMTVKKVNVYSGKIFKKGFYQRSRETWLDIASHLLY